MNAKVSLIRPPEFANPIEVTTCFCECKGKFLMLRRHPDDAHGDTWCAPGGGLEPSEELLVATVRELMEETGICIEVGRLQMLTTLFVELPDCRYILHMFRVQFTEQPDVIETTPEIVEARWVTPDEALQLNLIPGGREALEYYVKHL